jgi:hypothetical protein
MNLINVDLATESLTPRDCSFIADKNYPFCILGFQLKNAYDQTRLQLKKKYNVKDYVHLLPDSGLTFTPQQTINTLLNQLEIFNTSLTDLPLKRYESILSEYNLSCKNCYGSLQRGIYPIDGECIKNISKENIDLDDLYTNAFDTEHVAPFQAYAYFTIYILINKSVYRTGTDKIVSNF